jgi:hypothetical protein
MVEIKDSSKDYELTLALEQVGKIFFTQDYSFWHWSRYYVEIPELWDW